MSDEGYRMDPEDWGAFGDEMHALLDRCLTQLEAARDRPWAPLPEGYAKQVRIGEGDVLRRLAEDVLPYGTGNTHPAFFGWVHGTGQASGLAAELVAATMNANCGGRDHGAIYVEREVIRWLAHHAGLTEGAGGILTTGTSQATLYALHTARHARFGDAVRDAGLAGLPQLRVYAAQGAHSCVSKALQVMGHGRQAVVSVPVTGGRMDVDALARLMADDAAEGRVPFAVVGTAGSVNLGTYDDLAAIAEIAKAHGAWFHVDAAFGYWMRLAPAPWNALTAGMEAADSVALDGHKWLGVPYACGACLVRSEAGLRNAFTEDADYLVREGKALAGGAWWPTEHGIDLSRGFTALKFWAALQAHKPETIGAVIVDNCHQAALMGALAEASDWLDLAAPVVSNLCVMYPRAGDASTLVEALQLSGAAVFSTTMVDGRSCVRAAIVNHRTTEATIRDAVASLEAEIARAYQAGTAA